MATLTKLLRKVFFDQRQRIRDEMTIMTEFFLSKGLRAHGQAKRDTDEVPALVRLIHMGH